MAYGNKVFLVDEFPPCDQKGCAEHATNTLVWTKRQFYCQAHSLKALQVADALGFATPSITCEPLEIRQPDDLSQRDLDSSCGE